jgi:ATP-dependent Clp protease ATP-binding subunit ClpC
MDRFDKFTDRARKVLTLAQDEAQRFNHNYIGTEHLLLGLVREGEGVAARVLENMNVELSKVRTAVEFIIGRGDRPVVGEVGLTPRWRSTRPGAWVTTTSAPSISCSASSARVKGSPRGCSRA